MESTLVIRLEDLIYSIQLDHLYTLFLGNLFSFNVYLPFHHDISLILSRSMKKQQNDRCAQQRLRPAVASAQSDQSLRFVLYGLLRFLCADSEDSDQTRRMAMLIWVFASRKKKKISFCWFCHAAAHFYYYLKTKHLVTYLLTSNHSENHFAVTFNVFTNFKQIKKELSQTFHTFWRFSGSFTNVVTAAYREAAQRLFKLLWPFGNVRRTKTVKTAKNVKLTFFAVFTIFVGTTVLTKNV